MSVRQLLRSLEQALGLTPRAPDPGVYYHGDGDKGELTVVIQGSGIEMEHAVAFGEDLVDTDIVGIGYAGRTDDGDLVEHWISQVDLPARDADEGVWTPEDEEVEE